MDSLMTNIAFYLGLKARQRWSIYTKTSTVCILNAYASETAFSVVSGRVISNEVEYSLRMRDDLVWQMILDVNTFKKSGEQASVTS